MVELVDDYALARVPGHARYHWFSVATQVLGQTSAMTSFVVGARIGFAMSFWDAFLAITLGSVVLEVVCLVTGIMGQREGLTTYVLARWTGFGRMGSTVLAFIVGVSMIGWFGIQCAVAGNSLVRIMPWLPAWAWSLLNGLLITVVVVCGFQGMQWLAYIAVPLFLALVGWAIFIELSKHSFLSLLTEPAPGPPMSIVDGASLIAGGFIVGALSAPDVTRYNRSATGVVLQSLISIVFGDYLTGLSSVLLAHAVKSADVSDALVSSVGGVSVLVILLGTFKINDWNLYSAGLATVNMVESVWGWRINRAFATFVLGAVGSVLGAVGILKRLQGFLEILGVLFPPVVGIMIVEYSVVGTWNADLEVSRAAGVLPAISPTWVPASLVTWAVSALVGHFLPFGISSVNAMVFAVLLSVTLNKLGMTCSWGTTQTISAPATIIGGKVVGSTEAATESEMLYSERA